jgi:O-acetyl-ADP-ribose deacetylase (regulator of RNase III)
MREEFITGRKLQLIKGNIALLDVDAIVNAANKSLILGGGVAGAIRSLGGPSIQAECNELGPIEVGDAVITGGGDLKAQYVIHAAGPVYGEGDEDQKLRKATSNSLELALRKKIKKIAFPAISAGIFHFPIQRCSEIMLDMAIGFLEKNDYPEEITFCLYGDSTYSIFLKTLDKMLEDGSSKKVKANKKKKNSF